MAGTRALFASIGASAALVAAAALSLLAISAVFAFGGWSDSVSDAVTQPDLVFAGSDPADRQTIASTGSRSIVAPRPAPRTARRGDRRPSRPASRARRPAAPAAPQVASRDRPPVALYPNVPRGTDPDVAPAPPAARKAGDSVRKVGESLSSTVQDTGTALAAVTQPLAPPVSVAVQQVLNVVAEVVRRAAGGLGTTLDRLLPPKQ